MTSDHAGNDVRDWQLERYRLGELPDGEHLRVQDALERVPDVRRRLDDLDRSSDSLLQEHPPAAMVGALRARSAREHMAAPAPRHAWTPLAAAAIVAASLVGLAILNPWAVTPPMGDETRVKGLTPYLLLYRKAATEVERLPPAASARAHDVVQLAYQAGTRRYGVILSVDGRGVVTRHLPVEGARAVPLTPGTPVALPQSYELDDAPGFERFVLVAADEPFAVEQVERTLRRQHEALGAGANARRLELPDSMDQFSLVVRKEPSR
jgi:hypothetical protein